MNQDIYTYLADVKSFWYTVVPVLSWIVTINWFALSVLYWYMPGLNWYLQNSPLNPRPIVPQPIPPIGTPKNDSQIFVIDNKSRNQWQLLTIYLFSINYSKVIH